MNQSVKQPTGISPWLKLSRLITILLLLYGCWLAIENVWRLSRISRKLARPESPDAVNLLNTTESKLGTPSLLFEPLTGNEQTQGFWQFAGMPVAIGLRSVSSENFASGQSSNVTPKPCEGIDVTDFVEELTRFNFQAREFTAGGLKYKRFEFDSSEFSAWLIAAHSAERWKFCAGRLMCRSSASESLEFHVESVTPKLDRVSSAGSLGLTFPIPTVLIGSRFNLQREPLADLLVTSLSNSQTRDELQQAGYKLFNGVSLSPEVWTGVIQVPEKTVLFGCQLVQLAPSRCVMIVFKEHSR